jgi:hypothetical protein
MREFWWEREPRWLCSMADDDGGDDGGADGGAGDDGGADDDGSSPGKSAAADATGGNQGTSADGGGWGADKGLSSDGTTGTGAGDATGGSQGTSADGAAADAGGAPSGQGGIGSDAAATGNEGGTSPASSDLAAQAGINDVGTPENLIPADPNSLAGQAGINDIGTVQTFDELPHDTPPPAGALEGGETLTAPDLSIPTAPTGDVPGPIPNMPDLGPLRQGPTQANLGSPSQNMGLAAALGNAFSSPAAAATLGPAAAAGAAGLPGGITSAADILAGQTPVAAALDQAPQTVAQNQIAPAMSDLTQDPYAPSTPPVVGVGGADRLAAQQAANAGDIFGQIKGEGWLAGGPGTSTLAPGLTEGQFAQGWPGGGDVTQVLPSDTTGFAEVNIPKSNMLEDVTQPPDPRSVPSFGDLTPEQVSTATPLMGGAQAATPPANAPFGGDPQQIANQTFGTPNQIAPNSAISGPGLGPGLAPIDPTTNLPYGATPVLGQDPATVVAKLPGDVGPPASTPDQFPPVQPGPQVAQNPTAPAPAAGPAAAPASPTTDIGPTPSVAAPTAPSEGPGTVTPDLAAQLGNAGGGGADLGFIGGGSSDGGTSGVGGSTPNLAQMITQPIPAAAPAADGTTPAADGTSPPFQFNFPGLGDEGSPLGNFNPEEGLFVPPGLPGGSTGLPGGVQGPVPTMPTLGPIQDPFSALNNAGP